MHAALRSSLRGRTPYGLAEGIAPSLSATKTPRSRVWTAAVHYIPRDPSKSYWEGEWLFPPTGTKIAIGLPGSVEGPIEAGRAFYLALPGRFEEIVRRARPGLDRVFLQWMGRPLNSDLWRDVTLAGFGVEDRADVPTMWDVAFETLGQKWLGITIPFIADEPQEPVVDT